MCDHDCTAKIETAKINPMVSYFMLCTASGAKIYIFYISLQTALIDSTIFGDFLYTMSPSFDSDPVNKVVFNPLTPREKPQVIQSFFFF